MKLKYYAITLFLFIIVSAFAQSPFAYQQIIVKLKYENVLFDQSLNTEINFRNKKIQSITHKFHALHINALIAGRDNKQQIYVIRFPEGTDIQKVMEAYHKSGEIEYAEPDYIASGAGIQGTSPNDTYYGRQWGLKNDGSFTLSPAKAGADIDMESAWTIEEGDSNIIVGIIDSGSKLDHPEFSGRIWNNNKEIPNNGIDDDQNGYIDDVQGWDFANNDNNPTDDYGHGTNVSGIIGANGNNSMGYSGVDRHCKLMILKGLDKTNSGQYSWFASAIYYAVDNGARVINLSLGGISSSITVQNAVTYAINHNVVVVACMMNTNSNTVYYPAACPGVIAVGSTNANDLRTHPFFWSASSGSNYGNHISVVAPGNYIYGLNYLSNTNYDSYWGGTSQATPLVTGLAALLLAQHPERKPSEIKSIIESTAQDRVGDATEDIPGWDQYYGYGRVNAFKALSVPLQGIQNIHLSDMGFSVFPNPTNCDLTVKVPITAAEILIYNSLGELVHTRTTNGQTTFDFQFYDNGVYEMRIIISGKAINKKIVVCR